MTNTYSRRSAGGFRFRRCAEALLAGCAALAILAGGAAAQEAAAPA